MVVPKKILTRWRKVVKNDGVTAVANGTGLNFRTFKRAYDAGKCSDGVFDAIMSHVIIREKAIAARLAEIEDQN